MSKNNKWIYTEEFRRYKDGIHQLYSDGKWITINFKTQSWDYGDYGHKP